jgi:hypothetical protein
MDQYEQQSFCGLRIHTRKCHSLSECLLHHKKVLNFGIRNEGWNDLFEKAVFEPDPKRLAERITEAESAINARLQESTLQAGKEKQQLLDALNTLEQLSRFADPSFQARTRCVN